MKKLIALILTGILALGLVSCGDVSVSVGDGEKDDGPSVGDLAQLPPANGGAENNNAPDGGEDPQPPEQNIEDAADPQGGEETEPGENAENAPDGQEGDTVPPEQSGEGNGETPEQNENTDPPKTEEPPKQEEPPKTEEPSKTEEPPKTEEPKLTPAEAVALALTYVDQDISKLIAVIGEPVSSDYAPSCLGAGEDGNLYYDGFIVATYRDESGKEVVYDAYEA